MTPSLLKRTAEKSFGDYVKLGIGVALVAWLIYSTLLSQVSRRNDQLVTNYVESYVSQGRAAVDAYSQQVEKQLEASLLKLFEQLDVDADGCIRKDEFKGVSLGVLAAVQSFEVPPTLMPKFDYALLQAQLGHSFSWLRAIVGLQLTFLLGLFLFELMKSMVFPEPVSFVSEKYEDKTPEHCEKSDALRYDTPMTTYEKAKIAFFLVTGILFLRVALAALLFFMAVVCLNLSTYGGRTREKNSVWFNIFGFGTKTFGFLMIAAVGFYQVRTFGQPAPRDKVKLLIGNHVCLIELVVMFLQADFPAFVSRVENLEIPLFRGIARTSNAIMVNRATSASRLETLQEIVRRSEDKEGAQLMLFPEGTCNNQNALFQFKRGAFEPGQPVQMVCFRFPYTHFNLGWTGRASGGNDMPDLLLRMCTQFVNRLDVVYLPVYTPSTEEVEDPMLFARHCQKMMANVLQIPTSEATFEDYQAAARAYNRQHPEETILGNETPARATTPNASFDRVETDVYTE